jgi:hypothetical protein
MGVNTSKSSVDIINNAIVNVIVSAAQECSQAIDSTQVIQSSGWSLFSKFSQNVTLTSACLQSVKIDNNLILNMVNSIKSSLDQQAIALVPSVNTNVSDTNITNDLKTTININFLQKCVTSLKTYQQQTYGGLQFGVLANQDVGVVTKCLSDNIANTGVAQKISDQLVATSTQTQKNPLDFLTEMFGNFTWMIIMIFVAIFGGLAYAISG